MDSAMLLAEDKAPNVPTNVWTPPEQVTHYIEKAIQWSMWLGISLSVVGLIIFGAMMAIDRNRGEAGIATSDQARVVKMAIGVGLIATAPQFVTWILDAL